MAHWKARVEFFLSVIKLFFLSLTVEALQGKMCQNSLPSGVGRSLVAKISGEGVVPEEYFLVSTKLDTFKVDAYNSSKPRKNAVCWYSNKHNHGYVAWARYP